MLKTTFDILRHRAEQTPDRLAFCFLADGERESARLTFGQLDARARALGSFAQEHCSRGDRIVLMFPSGLDFITAFHGAIYGGAIPVPCVAPRLHQLERTLPRVLSITRDAQPSLIFTTGELAQKARELQGSLPQLQGLHFVGVDSIPTERGDTWRAPSIAPEDLALLQFTSGSTSEPKGVMVTHANLIANLEYIQRGFRHTAESVSVSWLPQFHDMGLIDGLLSPMYHGFGAYLMSPTAFLQKPLRWLEAICRYRATHSGGPNFAYEHCVHRSPPDKCAGIDLSSWAVAYNGAEPIHAETLTRFARHFEPFGFRRMAFYPCYGLAEFTLKVSGPERGEGPTVLAVDKKKLSEDQITPLASGDPQSQELVSVGKVDSGNRVHIVDPTTGAPLEKGRVGEIWALGPSLSIGYWRRPEDSKNILGARLPSGEGPFVRTGDLGFLHEDRLYVVGRIKDLILIRGQNFYPSDIESTTETAHPAIRLGSTAAFSVSVDGAERLVVVAEMERRTGIERRQAGHTPPAAKSVRREEKRRKNPVPPLHAAPIQTPHEQPRLNEVIEAIRRAVVEAHDISPFRVLLLRPGGLPKTSSGKTQRSVCRASFLAGTLDVL